MQADFAVVGVGVMGASLAQNLERNGCTVALFNRNPGPVEELLRGPGAGKRFISTSSLADLAAQMERPRRILLLVPAGAPVDDVLRQLGPHLQADDVVIDGGNSHWRDTERRFDSMDPTGVRFVGMGVSGGQDGALWGPSMMPGCDAQSYLTLEPALTKIAARTASGPCVTHVGRRSAGHFVKMVHNGIEYGDMQLIAEVYDLLRHGAGIEPQRLADVFAAWNAGELQSFLVEITARIVAFPDDLGTGALLVDRIQDAAGQKGTGRWTSESGLELGVAIPTLTAAVEARALSARRDLRQRLAAVYGGPVRRGDDALIAIARDALYVAKILAYAQGFDLLAAADREHRYGLQMSELARIWKGGCIIRAALLDTLRAAYVENPDLEHLLLAPAIAAQVRERAGALRAAVGAAQERGIAVPALAAALAYFDGMRRDRLPAALLQAQRDFFGAHTYQRTDREGTFHTHWAADH